MDIFEKSEKKLELETFIKKFIQKSTRYSGMPISVLKNKAEIIAEFDKYRERIKEQKQEEDQEEVKQLTYAYTPASVMVDQANEAIIAKTNYGRRKTDQDLDMLPIWADATRGAPNCFLRSALFGVIKRGPRKELKKERIQSIKGIEITYTGERLDQADLDVWCAVLHVSRACIENPFKFSFTSNDMLNILGLPATGGGNRESLDKRLFRLMNSSINIRIGDRDYTGRLINDIAREGIRKNYARQYIVELNKKLLILFAPDRWTALDWAVRHDLGNRALALWLHGFYSTHSKPLPYKVETIRNLCGSETSSIYHFKAELKKAIEDVCTLTKWTWDIDKDDKIHIYKDEKNIPIK